MPTSRSNSADRVHQNSTTNSATHSATSTNNMTMQDRAVTQRDRALLIRIHRTVRAQLQSLFAGTVVPVHFIVQSGVVELVGIVSTGEEKQRVETVVRQVPGVTRVVNRLEVNSQTHTSNSSQGSTGNLGATSTRTNQPSRIYHEPGE